MLRTPEPAAISTPSTPQTFRTFVTGPSNALAYNVALTVARTPGRVYNPLYLSGGSGLGKSHLLHAIGAYLAPRLHGAEVIVLSAAAFAQEFAAHLRQGHMLAFRRRYRRAGALLLDDIALLAGRDAAAEELVRTLDALREANRQIVLADEQEPGETNRAARHPRGRAKVEVVLQAICDYYGVSRPMLLGKSRELTVAQARQVAMYLLREDAGLTASQIGQELGRDHSTVLHGHARIASALKGGDAIMTVVLDGIRLSILQGQRDTA